MEKIISSNGETNNLPLFPSTLSGGEVTRFDPAKLPESPPVHPRQEHIDRAHLKGDPVVMERYGKVLIETAREIGVFGAWNVTTRYEKKFGKLDETNRKAIGRLWQIAIKLGQVVDAGVGRRPNGNLATVYRLKK